MIINRYRGHGWQRGLAATAAVLLLALGVTGLLVAVLAMLSASADSGESEPSGGIVRRVATFVIAGAASFWGGTRLLRWSVR